MIYLFSLRFFLWKIRAFLFSKKKKNGIEIILKNATFFCFFFFDCYLLIFVECSIEVDRFPKKSCSEWKRVGYCATTKTTRQLWCRKTCLCSSTTIPSDADSSTSVTIKLRISTSFISSFIFLYLHILLPSITEAKQSL